MAYGRKDQSYVIDLCDSILSERALREHRFEWLRGDPNRRGIRAALPVDAYYPQHRLVVEYWESQHDEPSAFFDKRTRLTVSGVHRGEQRARYDRIRQEEIPRHGLRLAIVRARDLVCDNRGRLVRDVARDQQALAAILRSTSASPASSRVPALPPGYVHANVRKNYANPVVRRIAQPKSGPRLPSRPAQASAASLRNVGGSSARTQRITAKDIAGGRIRFPASAKAFFPPQTADVEVDLRGRLLTGRWNPREGPDRARSGLLSVGRGPLAASVDIDEILTVSTDAGRIVLR